MCATGSKPHPFIQILSLMCECYLKDTSNLKLLTLPISLNFHFIYVKRPERGISL